jgi:peptidoglycan/LPS O-acetylase OafA/YrhL
MNTMRDAMRFQQLDAMRFFFALIVVLGHTVGFGLTLIRGGFAVDFFFILSGFVLSHALHNRPVSAKEFAWARFARLYPLHLVMLIWLTFLFPPFSTPAAEYSPQALALSVAMLQGFGIIPTLIWNGPAWSISVELFVNVLILFPIIRARAVLPAAALMLLAYTVVLTLWGADYSLINVQVVAGVFSCALLRGTGGIVLGYLLYEAYLLLRSRIEASRYTCFGTAFELLAIGTLIFCMWSRDAKWIVVPVPLSALLVFQMATVPGHVSNMLRLRVFSYLGTLSYSIYLTHLPLFHLFTKFGLLPAPETHFSVLWFAYLGALLLLSAGTFTLVERPAQLVLLRAFRGWARPRQATSY